MAPENVARNRGTCAANKQGVTAVVAGGYNGRLSIGLMRVTDD